MKSNVIPLGYIIPLIVFFITFPPALAEGKWSLTPRVYVEGKYDDNIFLSERNEETDFITTVSPGVNLNYLAPTGEFVLNYEFERSFYKDFPELDFSGHLGQAEARKDFRPWLGAEVRETFIQSQDPFELTGLTEFERPSFRMGIRERYIRNIVEPEVTFRFGMNRSIRLGYRNHVLRNKTENIADLDENAGNALFTFRFNIKNGIEVFYEHTSLNYGGTVPPSTDEDFDGDEILGRYTYYFNPITTVFLEYRYYERNFDTEPDYKVHNPSAGFSRDLLENVSLSARAGYVIRDAEGRKDEGAFSTRADLSTRYKGLTLSLYGESGFDEDYFSAERLGFNEFWRAGLNARYQIFEKLWAGGFFYIERDRFVDIDRGDRIWNARGSLNCQLLRWFALSTEYEHSARDSNVALESYQDNRYLGRITVQYEIVDLL